jgi:2-methylcitrate dehydratase PrpD
MKIGATRSLARFAVNLSHRQIPPEVIDRAKACILDTLVVALYGSTKPWSRTVLEFIRSSGAKGHSTVLGEGWKAQAPQATLANGVMAHAFELDNVRQPGAGVHPGATALLPALAMAEEKRADGRALLTAFVAACEVMSRIGVAAGNSLEQRGFHAPPLTGTFGAAVAVGRLLRLDETRMVSALGIAGSYSGGLMEFSRSQGGAMIKRLHLGKAAEGGATAALLARGGFSGPESVLEGKFGFCQVFSNSPRLAYLTHRLGREFETLNICIKRYACHINAHAPIEGLQKLKEQHRFAPEDVAEIIIGGIEKLVTHHSIYGPKDLMAAQYSVPFCAALSLHCDPADPESFSERAIRDRKIHAAARLVRLKVDREIEKKGWDRAARVTVRLKNGRSHTVLIIHFRGTPQNPLSRPELEKKARSLTNGLISNRRLGQLLQMVDSLEQLKEVVTLTSLLRRDA